ncbi:MAG: antirestriction protein ArdA [Dehalococcoidia bacterium]|nr:antirestriction protein ArdA [Dehalococcoidia bacterium]
MFNAYITNLGKYNAGELCGEWLSLPATKEDVQGLLGRIAVDGVIYEETFITDYDIDINGLARRLGEYESLDELNYLAARIAAMDYWERERFKAAIELGEHSASVKELINLTYNLNCYEFFPDVEDDDDLGRYLVEDMEFEEIPERLEQYFDYEAYGRDFISSAGGDFVGGGYAYRNGERFTEHYSGMGDIPDEYRIFYYPAPPDKMPVKQQLQMYSKMAQLREALPDKAEPELAQR